MMKKLLFILFFVSIPFFLFAQQGVYQDIQGTWRSKVVEIVSEREEIVPGTDVKSIFQTLKVEIIEGDRKGKIVEVTDDYFNLNEGDIFFLNYLITIDGKEIYSVGEPERTHVLLWFVFIFVCVIIVFGGMQGVRSIISLVGSFALILFVLLPKLIAGAPPVLTSIAVALVIMAFAMSLTHGINRKTIAAFLGTTLSILVTGVCAEIGVSLAKLSGFISEEAVYLNLNTRGELDLSGLLLSAIIIGVLGLLDDIAITQASAVEELRAFYKGRELYEKALRIGKEHVGALVNTLALAYAGASLPLLLLFSLSSASPLLILNREVFAAEIIRTVVGSIGLILAVPLSTALAIMLIKPKNNN